MKLFFGLLLLMFVSGCEIHNQVNQATEIVKKPLDKYLFNKEKIQHPISLKGDISKVQIEGLSVGDSLLKKYSKRQINRTACRKDYHKKKDYHYYTCSRDLSQYKMIQAHAKKRDQEIKLYNIQGIKKHYSLGECEKERKEVIDAFTNAYAGESLMHNDGIHPAYPKSGSKVYSSIFYLRDNSGNVELQCIHYKGKPLKDFGNEFELRVTINEKNFYDWLSYESFK